MRIIRVLFYKPDKKSGWISRAIGLWGKKWNPKNKLPGYSHVELEFCDRQPQEHLSEKGKCFSSATYRRGRQRLTGVRMAPASQILKTPEHWDYIEIKVDDTVEQLMYEEALNHCGQKYDYLAIFGFCLPVRIQDEGKWYCSEIVNHVCWMGGLIDEPKRWSPLASAQYYLEQGHGPMRQLRTASQYAER